MTTNRDRIYYACQALTVDDAVLKGVQSVGIDREIETESLLDVGHIQRRFQRRGKQQFTITISRVVSVGESLFYDSYNGGSFTDYATHHPLKSTNIGTDGISGLKERDIKIYYAMDDRSYVGATTAADATAPTLVTTYKKCIITNVSYSFNISGAFTEEITLISRTKEETSESVEASLSEAYPHTNNSVITRKHFVLNDCIFPDGVTNYLQVGNQVNGKTILGLQSVQVSMDISYRDLFNNGEWVGSTDSGDTQNKFRVVELPLGVSCTFTGVLRQQDTTSHPAVRDDYYANDQEIRLVAENGASSKFQWNLGQKNYLTNVSVSGGDTGGGNVEVSMSYQNDCSDFFAIDDSDLRDFHPSTPF